MEKIKDILANQIKYHYQKYDCDEEFYNSFIEQVERDKDSITEEWLCVKYVALKFYHNEAKKEFIKLREKLAKLEQEYKEAILL